MRIITGEFKGRRLRAPEHVRPTSEFAREALFSILDSRAEGTFVDCFAGAGAVGLEARSRGARVVLVEKDAASVAAIRQNLETLNVQGGVSVVHDDALRFLKSPPAGFLQAGEPADVVFCDPPWDYHAQDKLLRVLAKSPLVGDRTIVVVERRRGTRARPPEELRLARQESYGETEFSFYRLDPAPGSADPSRVVAADSGPELTGS